MARQAYLYLQLKPQECYRYASDGVAVFRMFICSTFKNWN